LLSFLVNLCQFVSIAVRIAVMETFTQETIDLIKAERDALLRHILSAVGHTMDQKSKEFIQGILDRSAIRLLSVDEYKVDNVEIIKGVTSFDPKTGETHEYRSVEQACLLLGTRRDRIENALRTGGKHLKLRWSSS
jgi:hypothetical protein